MRIPQSYNQIRRSIDARIKQLAPRGPVVAGTVSQIHKNCGRPSCHCLREGTLHSAFHFTCKVKNKTRTVYIPKDLLDEVRSWIEEHRRLRRLRQEIQQLTLALIRAHARHRRLRKGRP